MSQDETQERQSCAMKSSMPANERRRPQPSSVYNVFFTLERLRLIDTNASSSGDSETNQLQKSYNLDGYESLTLPELPPRYQHLQLPMGWFVPGKNSKRSKHTKSKNDSTLPILEQTRIIAANYKTIDKETKDYCLTVSGMLKQRHSLLITNEMLLQEAKACQPKKNKNPSGKLMQREVSCKKSLVATTKTSGDTEIEHATKTTTDDVAEPSAPTTWVNQSTVNSNLLTLSQAYIDKLHCSTIPDDPKKKEWNHVPNDNICLTFVNNHLPIQVIHSAEDEGVSTAYKTEEFPIDDSFMSSESQDDEEDSDDILLGRDKYQF